MMEQNPSRNESRQWQGYGVLYVATFLVVFITFAAPPTGNITHWPLTGARLWGSPAHASIYHDTGSASVHHASVGNSGFQPTSSSFISKNGRIKSYRLLSHKRNDSLKKVVGWLFAPLFYFFNHPMLFLFVFFCLSILFIIVDDVLMRKPDRDNLSSTDTDHGWIGAQKTDQ
jgi:hypothetical protein